jgi:hypothetical protein
MPEPLYGDELAVGYDYLDILWIDYFEEALHPRGGPALRRRSCLPPKGRSR